MICAALSDRRMNRMFQCLIETIVVECSCPLCWNARYESSPAVTTSCKRAVQIDGPCDRSVDRSADQSTVILYCNTVSVRQSACTITICLHHYPANSTIATQWLHLYSRSHFVQSFDYEQADKVCYFETSKKWEMVFRGPFVLLIRQKAVESWSRCR